MAPCSSARENVAAQHGRGARNPGEGRARGASGRGTDGWIRDSRESFLR